MVRFALCTHNTAIISNITLAIIFEVSFHFVVSSLRLSGRSIFLCRIICSQILLEIRSIGGSLGRCTQNIFRSQVIHCCLSSGIIHGTSLESQVIHPMIELRFVLLKSLSQEVLVEPISTAELWHHQPREEREM